MRNSYAKIEFVKIDELREKQFTLFAQINENV